MIRASRLEDQNSNYLEFSNHKTFNYFFALISLKDFKKCKDLKKVLECHMDKDRRLQILCKVILTLPSMVTKI